MSASESASPIIIRRGKYRFPPGLRLNLPLYSFAKFFDPKNPILLFEHLKRFGRAAHYRLLWHHVVLLNDPSDIREVLVREPRHFGALSGLGLILQEIGDEKHALEAYRRALAIDPHLENVEEAIKNLREKVEGREI